jgi:hypothetical protein
MNENEQYLKILAIFYYILGALLALVGFFPIIHLWLGYMMVFMPNQMGGRGNPPPAALGWFFMIMAAGVMVSLWGLALCMILTGRYLIRHRHHMFCLVIAALVCMNAPLGTVLGVFTLVLLLKPEVKEMFEGRADGLQRELPAIQPEPPAMPPESTAIQPDYQR